MPMMTNRVVYLLVLLICWVIFEAVVIKPVRLPFGISYIVVSKSSFFALKCQFFLCPVNHPFQNKKGHGDSFFGDGDDSHFRIRAQRRLCDRPRRAADGRDKGCLAAPHTPRP